MIAARRQHFTPDLLAGHVVTGGAGFIGSHLVDALVRRGDRVVVLDDLSSGREANLEHRPDAIEVRRVDVASDALDRHFAGVDTVFHLAEQLVPVPHPSGASPRPRILKSDILSLE